MKIFKPKCLTYIVLVLFAGYLTGSCEKCDDGNNFEDQETTLVVDSLSVAN